MKAPTVTIDISEVIPSAFKILWEGKIVQREKYKDRPRWANDAYYVTATELERQVRGIAEDIYYKRPIGTTPFGGYLRIRTNLRGTVLDLCRNWLLKEMRAGRLNAHNFNRGHISGMRFRPAGEPVGPAEIETFNEKAKPPRPKQIHYRESYRKLLCMKERNPFRSSRSNARSTEEFDKVSCPRCMKMLSNPDIKSKMEEEIEARRREEEEFYNLTK